jgi:hypothetical protein
MGITHQKRVAPLGGVVMQDIDGSRWNGDSLHPCRKRLRKAGRQMVKDFMA